MARQILQPRRDCQGQSTRRHAAIDPMQRLVVRHPRTSRFLFDLNEAFTQYCPQKTTKSRSVAAAVMFVGTAATTAAVAAPASVPVFDTGGRRATTW